MGCKKKNVQGIGARIRRFGIAAMFLLVLSQVGAVEQGSQKFTLELTPGAYHKTTTKWFLFTIKIYPQAVVWLETMDGEYIDTLYVTQKGEQQSWKAAPKTGRPEALPVWYHKRQGQTDAVSSATESGKTVYDTVISAALPAGSYRVMLETNRSYDYNATYTKENSGVSGQPSILYSTEITVGKGPVTAVFTPIGTGSPDGSDGMIYHDFTGIDTALELFSSMTITYHE